MARFRSEVSTELKKFLTEQGHYLNAIGLELEPVTNSLKSFLLDGGKRFRPLFAYVGYLTAGGVENNAVVKAVASLELLHACALIHDDVMDGSDTRRSAPAIHKVFETMHAEDKLSGDSQNFGLSSAILLGDLALIWSDQMLNQSDISIDARIRSLTVHDEMRVELMAGQYLDLFEQALASKSLERSLKVARYKSGKYSIERPLHFGAAIATSEPNKYQDIFSKYGLPLGEAFQLRDDLLGVFGNPDETGKPAGDDLREGKRTALIAITTERANPLQLQVIEKYFGKADLDYTGVTKLREIITNTGAVTHLEKLISELTERAQNSINDDLISQQHQTLLTDLALVATKRSY